MFGFGKYNFNSSMTIIYLFLFIFLFNQLNIVSSFRLMSSDLDQNEGDDVRRAIVRQLAFGSFENSGESSDDNDLQLLVNRPIQRRFCCMSPLSGRKRSIRDLTRQQINKPQA